MNLQTEFLQSALLHKYFPDSAHRFSQTPSGPKNKIHELDMSPLIPPNKTHCWCHTSDKSEKRELPKNGEMCCNKCNKFSM